MYFESIEILPSASHSFSRGSKAGMGEEARTLKRLSRILRPSGKMKCSMKFFLSSSAKPSNPAESTTQLGGTTNFEGAAALRLRGAQRRAEERAQLAGVFLAHFG